MTHLGDETRVLRASVRLFDAKAKRAEVFLLICEEFGIGICITYSPVQRRNRRSFGAFRGRERKEARARGEKPGQKEGRERGGEEGRR